MHVRDFTKSPTSGDSENLGTFLRAAQTGTVNQYGQATLPDYINSALIMFGSNQSLIVWEPEQRMGM